MREDAQVMANGENGLVSPEQAVAQPAAPGRTRAGKPAGPAFKPMHHDDMDPKVFSDMLAQYDDSFRNMAEGEVVKGTVLKVTESAVVVDVGYKSEGLIQIHEFLDETGNVTQHVVSPMKQVGVQQIVAHSRSNRSFAYGRRPVLVASLSRMRPRAPASPSRRRSSQAPAAQRRFSLR